MVEVDRDDERDVDDREGEDLEVCVRDVLLTERDEEELLDGVIRLGAYDLLMEEEDLIREEDRLDIEEDDRLADDL